MITTVAGAKNKGIQRVRQIREIRLPFFCRIKNVRLCTRHVAQQFDLILRGEKNRKAESAPFNRRKKLIADNIYWEREPE